MTAHEERVSRRTVPAADTQRRAVLAAKHQSLFREVNERLNGLNDAFDGIASSGEWVCECADPACTDRLELSTAGYERIRRHSERFAVKPGHELLDGENVVERHADYFVVEKLGIAAELARLRDARVQDGAGPASH
jgi:hypothetical protein